MAGAQTDCKVCQCSFRWRINSGKLHLFLRLRCILKQRFVLWLLKGVGRLPLGMARALGACVGWLLYKTNSRAARVTKVNLALCFPAMPQPERDQLARKSLIETGRTGAEIPVLWQRKESWLRQHALEYEGIEYIRRSREAGKGIIMLTPHLGNWELLPCILTLHGKITVLYQPPKDNALEDYIASARRRSQVALAPTNRRGVAMLIKALKAGEMVGILPDQVPDSGNGGVEALFFGEPAMTMTLVHNLMRRTDCEVLMCYALRVAGGFKVVVTPCEGGINEPDLIVGATALNKTVQSSIEKAPAQYQWEYKRFKGRKQGEPY
ncbi:lysophospholipid acyltransferase family protein [Gilvimarinus sp. SDUM040013]|uniref:Lysophospholipid acyltransferase family protein n=1 Tax=Gilvimarinus gilvus TaxID=3058038 RepID=A0ABU4RVF3_9GAMM|nr:lysophospholipid acyltransferase family protein [Gilvimarinus sp. SDUM040013]MDO3387709.1 lysophospholipid acyltransferase family protein [Gilvimarinus sp. SDUM040013]MDX6848850.1 lysophospholipid acyltransferase family protein [Gilvimarinus sp. SDUM040013]